MKRWVTWADLLTGLRVPLAVAFPFMHHPRWQLALVGAAAASDFFDGMLARRLGSSRVGAVLDPVADKLFMAAAFATVWRWGRLHPVEVLGVLARDLVAALAFAGTWLLRRPVALPARAGGKVVTVLQLCTLTAVILQWPLADRLAWATAAVGLYAIWDYGRAAWRWRAAATRGSRVLGAGLVAAALAGSLAAQEFHPPAVRRSSEGTRIGLFGFGVRGGVDLTGQTQMVFGVTLDAGNLVTSRLRIRPAGEIGVFNGANSYVGTLEGVYRFTGDEQVATPYVGAGFSVAGHDRCGSDPDCPDVWLNVVIGFELHYRSTFNWLLEYHGMDAFGHNRVYVGLTTRRGN